MLAVAAWSRLAEPGDEVAGALVAQLGASESLRWLVDEGTAQARADSRGGPVLRSDGAQQAVTGPGSPRGGAARGGAARGASARLARAVARWTPRLADLDPRRELRVLDSLGGTLLTPADPRWPHGLDSLELAAPLCLWVRGDPELAHRATRSVAVVGARAATAYGSQIAGELAAGLADRHITVVSGGAYGIDAAAHRGALAAGGRTVAFLAGGVDRLYPAGNADLLGAIVDDGSVISEVPPGSAPTRVRFLLRNRLIAAFAGATVVVEAAWRSGSLATAARAAELLRPVGVVPGPVTSMASAGCHRLLRETDAVCVTDAAEAAELIGAVGSEMPPEPVSSTGPLDDLDEVGARIWEALPLRQPASIESVARTAGLAVAEVLGGLGHLELLGRVRRAGGGWRRESEVVGS